MVEVSYLGHSSFKISGKDISLVADPYYDAETGLRFPRAEANVVTISHNHKDHNNKSAVKGDPICFDTPGEYEIRGAEIVGIPSFHDDKKGEESGRNTIFVYEIEGVKLCHLGDLGHELTSEQIENIDGVDVLFVPVGGTYTIDSKKAAKVVAAIGPKIVVPMHYKTPKIDMDPVDNFLKEMGKDPKKVAELKIKKKELGEDLEIVLLNPKSK